MADKKPSGFRFRLPWLLQPTLTPARAVAPEPPTQPPRTTIQTPEPPSQPPRTTTQTTGASTSSQRRPFRPPGKAPAPAAPPPAPVATPSPASPRRSPPQSVASPPPPPPQPKSPIAKTIEAVATQPTKEAKTTTETTVPPTLPQRPPLTPPKQAQSPPSPPQTPPPQPPPKLNSQPSSPKANWQQLSPTRMVAQPSSPPHDSTPPRAATQRPSPVHVQPSQTLTPPQSPSRIASKPTNKTSPLPSPSPHTKSTSEFAEIKRSTDKPQEKFPMNSNHVPQADDDDSDIAFNRKPKEMTKLNGTQTRSMNPQSMETKSQKPKRVPLQKEIKDDISKFIHKISTTSPNQHMNEQPASVITVAGDNQGASMHLGSDATNTDSKSSEYQETTAIVNSNIQGINNSIMFNSSVAERNPGVHLGFHRNLRNSFTIRQSEVPPESFLWIRAIMKLMILIGLSMVTRLRLFDLRKCTNKYTY